MINNNDGGFTKERIKTMNNGGIEEEEEEEDGEKEKEKEKEEEEISNS